MIPYELLRARQAMPLEAKVIMSTTRIREWIARWGWENVSVSYSGGKDSTVLLHLVRSVSPSVRAVFSCTGLEYPEILDHVRATPNVTWVRPKKTFQAVIEQYGWPVVSKRVSQYVHQARTTRSEYLRNMRIRGSRIWARIPSCWMHLLEAPFQVSHACCAWLKQKPLRQVKDNPFVGVMASDGKSRELDYVTHGCNLYDAKMPISRPMSFWTSRDVWDYIHAHELPYSRIYDMGYSRTGCMFCSLGLHMETRPHRFDLMKRTHPKLFDSIMNRIGLRPVLEYTYRNKPKVLSGLFDDQTEV